MHAAKIMKLSQIFEITSFYGCIFPFLKTKMTQMKNVSLPDTLLETSISYLSKI